MTVGRRPGRAAAVLLLAAALGALGLGLRFWRLEEIPGFEHDEALICLGARSILAGARPLTGDKLWEGPLAEYLVALSFGLAGEGVAAARAVVALATTLALVVIALLARRLYGPGPALAVLALAAVEPWAVAQGRTLYACNLVTLTAPLALLAASGAGRRRPWLLALAGAAVGLSLHGHVYTGILLVPVLAGPICLRPADDRPRPVWLAVAAAAALAVYSPVLVYQASHGFPALRLYWSSSEAHFAARQPGSIPARWVGYAHSALAALRADPLWLDFELPPGRSGRWLWPALALAGAASVAAGARRRGPDRLVAGWALAILIAIPLVSKHRPAPRVWGIGLPSPAHYLDVFFPLPWLAAASLIGRLTAGRRRWMPVLAGLLAAAAAAGGLRVLARDYFGPFAAGAGPGRWAAGVQSACRAIDLLEPTPDVVLAGHAFEAGYPQARFLLPDHDVRPVWELPTRVPGLTERPAVARVAYLVRTGGRRWSDLEPVWRTPVHDPVWLVQVWSSPELQAAGRAPAVPEAAPAVAWEVRLDAAGGRGRLAVDGGEWVLEQLAREDLFSPNPALAGRAFLVTQRHRDALAPFTRLHTGSRVRGLARQADVVRPFELTLSWTAGEPVFRLEWLGGLIAGPVAPGLIVR